MSRLLWFRRKFEEGLKLAGLRFVDLVGRPFDSGTAATPMNADDFGPDDDVVVEAMIDPVIVAHDGTVVQRGTVTLKKAR